jgi:hypothetical protein
MNSIFWSLDSFENPQTISLSFTSLKFFFCT